MPRLNFFTPLLEEQKISPLRSKGLIIFIVLLLVAGSYLAIQLQAFVLKKNVATKEQELNAVKTTQLNEVLELKRKIATQQNYKVMAEALEQEITTADYIRLQLIEKILDTVPQNVFFQDLRLSRTEWQLLGFANNRQTIAKFEYNLKESGLVDKIEIKNINSNVMENMGEIFVFNMGGTFKQEVVEHEVQ
ncbi:MAG: PilN domain-containing protein [Clostridia bacterium]|jgi:Tfp pilus assembly protein PilN|nr:PilN domain-containing protein [Clostridia bacterium]